MNKLENIDSKKDFENTPKIFKKKNSSLYIGDLSTRIQENDILKFTINILLNLSYFL